MSNLPIYTTTDAGWIETLKEKDICCAKTDRKTPLVIKDPNQSKKIITGWRYKKYNIFSFYHSIPTFIHKINCRFVSFACPNRLCCWSFHWQRFRSLFAVWVEMCSIQNSFERNILSLKINWFRKKVSKIDFSRVVELFCKMFPLVADNPMEKSVFPFSELEICWVSVFAAQHQVLI